jgi:tetratricopeptide (TPR) repeat protein
MFESGMEVFKELEDIRSQIFTYLDMSFIRMEKIEKSKLYVESAYELAKNFGNNTVDCCVSICIGYHYSIWGGSYELGDDFMKTGIEMVKEIDDKKMESLGIQLLGESLYQQGNYQESLYFYEESLNINEEIDLKLWKLGTVLGIAINRKKLGLEIEFDILNKELEQKYNKSNNYLTQTYIDYCQYIIYEETKYVQMAYDGVMKISDKLEVKDREKFLNSPWMKILIKEWEKNNEL